MTECTPARLVQIAIMSFQGTRSACCKHSLIVRNRVGSAKPNSNPMSPEIAKMQIGFVCLKTKKKTQIKLNSINWLKLQQSRPRIAHAIINEGRIHETQRGHPRFQFCVCMTPPFVNRARNYRRMQWHKAIRNFHTTVLEWGCNLTKTLSKFICI